MKIWGQGKRCISGLLTVLLLLGTLASVGVVNASGETRQQYIYTNTNITPDVWRDDDIATPKENFAPDEIVRISIQLKKDGAVDAGYPIATISKQKSAVNYRKTLLKEQKSLANKIERKILKDERLDVVWNLTLAANIISANVEYRYIEKIRKMSEVKDVVIEETLTPLETVDEDPADANGLNEVLGSQASTLSYTGAGSRIAIIDTGIDSKHRSFDNEAYLHSLQENAGGKSLSEYQEQLDVLTKSDVISLYEQNLLNVKDGIDPDDLFINDKLPYGYNYADNDTNTDFSRGGAGEHGSHVAGIAAANRFLPKEGEDGAIIPGEYVDAMDTVKMVGVAPDAQIIVLKVFGFLNGAKESDCVAAIEDAIALGADSINMSLGNSATGFNRNKNLYCKILDSLTEKGVVLACAAGNSGRWTEYSKMNGKLLAEDVCLSTLSSPGSYYNALSVASSETGYLTGVYMTVGGNRVYGNENSYNATKNPSIMTCAGEQQYVLIPGTFKDIDKILPALKGKIAVVDGPEKQETLFKLKTAGIRAMIFLNGGSDEKNDIRVDKYFSNGDIPVLLIGKGEDQYFRDAAKQPLEGFNDCFEGKLTIDDHYSVGPYSKTADYISSFSSYGVNSSLALKPEITAPGRYVWSVHGNDPEHKGYTLLSGTSMSSPKIAGMVGVLNQYISQLDVNGRSLLDITGLNKSVLATSLLMSTAKPMWETDAYYYSLLRQGSGLANLDNAVKAKSLILVGDEKGNTGKVKAEIGDNPTKENPFEYTFTIWNFSDKDRYYTLSTDLFTQQVSESNGKTWLEDATRALEGQTTYYVGDNQLSATSKLAADVNMDGKTDEQDAQAILDFLANKISQNERDKYNFTIDLNKDGVCNSYDAHLILAGLQSEALLVPAGEKVTVRVEIMVTDTLSEFKNGAYVEGFTYVSPVDGADDAQHSIPILGFQGNWSDPDMFDKLDYIEAATNQIEPNYVTSFSSLEKYNYNYMSYIDAGGRLRTLYGNPFSAEAYFDITRQAIRSADMIDGAIVVPIRTAGAAALVIRDADTNEVLSVSNIKQLISPPTPNISDYTFTADYVPFHVSLKDLGITKTHLIISVVGVPEYYEREQILTEGKIKEMLMDGTLGAGVEALKTEIHVDDKAPEITGEPRIDGDKITISAEDNQYIAYIAIHSPDGRTLLGDAVPAGQLIGGQSEHTFTLGSKAPDGDFLVTVGDYAGNTVTKLVTKESEQIPNTNGQLISFFASGNRSGGLFLIDPNTVDNSDSSYKGMTRLGYLLGDDMRVIAGDYVADRYVFLNDQKSLWTVDIEDLQNRTKLADLDRSGIGDVQDIAYSLSDKKLYAVDGSDKLWKIDLFTGECTVAATIEVLVSDGVNASPASLISVAADDKGNILLITKQQKDLRFISASISQFNEETLACRASNTAISAEFVTLAWDEGNQFYAASAQYAGDNYNNKLYLVTCDLGGSDVTLSNGKALRTYLRGLAMVRERESEFQPTNGQLHIWRSELALPAGGSAPLYATLNPWLEGDRTLQWQSNNEAVATVTPDGVVKAVSPGTAVISVTAAADSNIQASCQVTVSPALSLELHSLVTENNGAAYWSKFNVTDPDNAEWLADTATFDFLAGAISQDGMLYAGTQDGFYVVNPQTYSAERMNGEKYSSIAPYKDFTTSSKYATAVGLMEGSKMRFLDPVNYKWIEVRGDKSVPSNAAVIARYDVDENSQTNLYYIISNDGTLYEFTLHDVAKYPTYKRLGKLEGVNLSDVSKAQVPNTASLYYDDQSGYLILTSRLATESYGKLQIIDPKQLLVVQEIKMNDARRITVLHKASSKNNDNDVGAKASAIREVAAAADTSLYAVQDENVVIDKAKQQVELRCALKKTTNGLWKISYDKDILKFVRLDGSLSHIAYKDDKQGLLSVAFASADVVDNEQISIIFSYESKQGIDTNIKVKTVERNEKYQLEETNIIPVVDKKRTLKSIAVTQLPQKTNYLEGKDELDVSGGKLTLYFDDNTTEEIDLDISMVASEFNNRQVGPQTVKVEHQGFTATFDVTVVKKELVSIRISQPPKKTKYIEGTKFDPTGMELTLTYNTDTEETVSVDWEMIGDYDFSKPGKAEVPITYEGKTTSLTVTVIEKSTVGIKVSELPDKVTYLEGKDVLDVSGGKLRLYYDNGTTTNIELSADMVTSKFDNTKVGKQTVEVSYEGCTATFEVTVQAKDIDRIEISARPQKTEYIEGTEFDPTGMEITIYYNNGTSETVSEGWTLDYDFSTVDEGKVTVSYQGHKAELPVTVKAKMLTKIEVSQMPSKTAYVQGDAFDPTGMVLTLTYDNGTSETVSEGWMLDYDFSKAGTQAVKVTYGGVETSLTVTVAEKQTQPSEPQKPADPQQPTDPQQSVDPNPDKKDEDTDGPQTGDDSPIGLWLMLMLLSGGALAALSVRRKRRQSDGKN